MVGVGILAALALVVDVAYGLTQRAHAKENAMLLVNYAAEVSCLTLQHVSLGKGSPEDKLRAEADVNEMLRAVDVNDVRRETFALNFVPASVGNEPAFRFAVDDTRAAQRGWSATLRRAVDDEAQHRIVLKSTVAAAGAGESCRSALARFERRPKASPVTTAPSEAQRPPG